MKLLLSIVALLFIASISHARIGDTMAEAETRYGAPVESKDGYNERHKSFLYYFKNYIIMVEFLDGKSHSEYFKKENETPLTDTEAETILAANQFNSKWKTTMGNSKVGWWTYELGNQLRARRDDNKGYLFIRTVTFQEFRESAKTASEKDDLKGF